MNDRHADGHTPDPQAINVVFDGPPGPQPGRFIEVEDDDGRSISVGTWIERGDGCWSLRIERTPNPAMLAALREAREHIVKERDRIEREFPVRDTLYISGEDLEILMTECNHRLATIDAAIQKATGAQARKED